MITIDLDKEETAVLFFALLNEKARENSVLTNPFASKDKKKLSERNIEVLEALLAKIDGK